MGSGVSGFLPSRFPVHAVQIDIDLGLLEVGWGSKWE